MTWEKKGVTWSLVWNFIGYKIGLVDTNIKVIFITVNEVHYLIASHPLVSACHTYTCVTINSGVGLYK